MLCAPLLTAGPAQPQLGVEDLRVSARVRVAMRPLLRRLPIVGAVQVGGGCPGWGGALLPCEPPCAAMACRLLANVA